MEGIGSEVSQKIRAAIKAKLIELGAYVDDELPDYIMVMVANKRTKSQMDEDLQLFLTSNTKTFTSWLHTVLQKLQEVTVATFEKKNSEGKKSLKKRKSDTDGGGSRKSSDDDGIIKNKKHSKKHKESKKNKKSKHKSKEKVKYDKPVKESKKEKTIIKQSDEFNASQNKDEVFNRVGDVSKHHPVASECDASNKSSTDNLIKSKNDELLKTSSSFPNKKSIFISDKETNDLNIGQNKNQDNLVKTSAINKNTTDGKLEGLREENNTKKGLIEDEFNIEPLQPAEKFCTDDQYLSCVNVDKDSNYSATQVEKTVSAPTEELLKKHNKLLNEKLKTDETTTKNYKSDSEESTSPEEMRKQLLLSRAKKKLENSKLADRMRSNSPDVLVIEDDSKNIEKDLCFSSSQQDNYKPSTTKSTIPYSNTCNKYSNLSPDHKKFSSSSHLRKSHSPESSSHRYRSNVYKTKEIKNKEENKRKKLDRSSSKDRSISSSYNDDRELDKKNSAEEKRKNKNIIKISESLELEKNFGVKKEKDKNREKESSTNKKKSIFSRVVTITGPEAPEISSIVKVKPREFIAKDKQANKALILKAVADAEKSIATINTRVEPEPEMKREALFTKNLRGKRFEKLAVTLSNIRKSSERSDSKLGSEKSDKSRCKLDSSEKSKGHRGKSDLFSREMSKSEDQFISSKTTIMEKNDKYIRCWLEGVEKAVKDDEMVNPDDMEDLIIQTTLSDDEIEFNDNDKKRKKTSSSNVSDKNFKNQKLSDQEIANLRVIPDSKSNHHDGPQIVVTLDGLDSKTIKDIILRNKQTVNGPILNSSRRLLERETDVKRKSSSDKEKGSDSCVRKKTNVEKISDRFARLNNNNNNNNAKMSEDGTENSENEARENTEMTRSGGATDKKISNSKESKNRQLIAQLSEKFGKVDRDFVNKKRKYDGDDDRKYGKIREAKKMDKREDAGGNDRNEKYKKSERTRSTRDESPPSHPLPGQRTSSSSSGHQICKFYPNCKNIDCRYYHPKKCRFDSDCTNPDCKYVHSETVVKKKFKWYSKS